MGSAVAPVSRVTKTRSSLDRFHSHIPNRVSTGPTGVRPTGEGRGPIKHGEEHGPGAKPGCADIAADRPLDRFQSHILNCVSTGPTGVRQTRGSQETTGGAVGNRSRRNS